MSATMLSACTFTTPASFGTARRQHSRRMHPVCAVHRPSSGFKATDAFQQAARQFAQFQKQQQRAASRSNSSRTGAFREGYGPWNQWNFDSEQVSKFMKEVDRAFGGDGSNVPSADSMQDAATSLRFPVDIRESSTEYKYLVDLPGVPKSDIKVQVDKDRKLIIRGERDKEEIDVNWRQQKQERRFGAFQRKFQLPEDADVDQIMGKAEDGVLVITISKVPKDDVHPDSTSIPIY